MKNQDECLNIFSILSLKTRSAILVRKFTVRSTVFLRRLVEGGGGE